MYSLDKYNKTKDIKQIKTTNLDTCELSIWQMIIISSTECITLRSVSHCTTILTTCSDQEAHALLVSPELLCSGLGHGGSDMSHSILNYLLLRFSSGSTLEIFQSTLDLNTQISQK